jgi:hypothetical protein
MKRIKNGEEFWKKFPGRENKKLSGFIRSGRLLSPPEHYGRHACFRGLNDTVGTLASGLNDILY